METSKKQSSEVNLLVCLVQTLCLQTTRMYDCVSMLVRKKLSTNPGGKKAYQLIKRKKRKTYKALFLVGKDK